MTIAVLDKARDALLAVSARIAAWLDVPADKVAHAIAGAGIGAVGAAGAAALGQATHAPVIGLAAAALVGAAKEVWDWSGHGTPSVADALATAAGGAVAALVAQGVM